MQTGVTLHEPDRCSDGSTYRCLRYSPDYVEPLLSRIN